MEKDEVKKVLEKYQDYDFGTISVNSIDIMESKLGKEGPNYHIIEKYKLR